MTLSEQINQDIKQAMLAKEKAKLEAETKLKLKRTIIKMQKAQLLDETIADFLNLNTAFASASKFAH